MVKVIVNDQDQLELFNYINQHLSQSNPREYNDDLKNSRKVTLPEPKKMTKSEYIKKYLKCKTLRVKGNQEGTCRICFEKIGKGNLVRMLSCKHVFHKNCIDEWLDYDRENFACPLCRESQYQVDC